MKKKILCMFFISIFLISCGKEERKDYGNSYVPEQDVQNFSGTQDAVFMGGGFYVANGEGMIDFIDCESGKTAPLCGKPNCSHEDESCNAYFENPSYIGAYDGYLYIIAVGNTEQDSRILYRVSPDGSERKEIRTLYSFEEEEDASLSLDFAIHRGDAYMITNWIEMSRKEREQVWYRLPMEEGEERTELYRIKGYSPIINMVDFDANYIYVHASYWEDEDLKKKVERNLRFDIRTDEITEINIPEGTFMLAAVQGTLYYANHGEDKTDLFRIREDGSEAEQIYEWEHTALPVDGIFTIYKDKRFLYLENDKEEESSDPLRECKIIDYDGHEVSQLGEEELEGKSLCWSNSEKLLFRNYENEKYEMMKLQ